MPIEQYFMYFATSAGIFLGTMVLIKVLHIDEMMKGLCK